MPTRDRRLGCIILLTYLAVVVLVIGVSIAVRLA